MTTGIIIEIYKYKIWYCIPYYNYSDNHMPLANVCATNNGTSGYYNMNYISRYGYIMFNYKLDYSSLENISSTNGNNNTVKGTKSTTIENWKTPASTTVTYNEYYDYRNYHYMVLFTNRLF